MSDALLPGERDLYLAAKKIQGNVYPGFKSDYQSLRGVRFADAPSARAWAGAIGPRITTAAEVAETRRVAKDQDEGRPEPKRPWVNVAFTFPALQLLGVQADFTDAGFRVGMERRRTRLNDDPALHASWKLGGANPIHALVIVAAASGEEAASAADDVARGRGVERVYSEEAATLARRGHEHFGFRDGVSQPALFGRYPEGDPLSPRDWTTPPADGRVLMATPGSPLVWPGQFVFGYPSHGRGNQRVPGPVVHAGREGHALTDNGSLLVLRRLRQDVALFHRVCEEKAVDLDRGGWPGMTRELLEALIVGRWPSGAPVDARSPVDPGADAEMPPNAFDFSDDAEGLACPFAAHIRKVNPRAGQSDVVPPEQRRVLRRGVPYGSELSDPMRDDGVDRGLVFISYQTSIDSQFEDVVDDWMNDPDRPTRSNAGHDVLIGQEREGPRRMKLFRGGQAIDLEVGANWVVPTGGVYAFAPSIDAMNSIPQ